jgi:hypothetical protein
MNGKMIERWERNMASHAQAQRKPKPSPYYSIEKIDVGSGDKTSVVPVEEITA